MGGSSGVGPTALCLPSDFGSTVIVKNLRGMVRHRIIPRFFGEG